MKSPSCSPMIIGGISWLCFLPGQSTPQAQGFTTMESVGGFSFAEGVALIDADVGRPRDYKWINTISLAKSEAPFLTPHLPAYAVAICGFRTAGTDPLAVWEQLNIAQTFNMTQVWILNVGDIKLLEIPLDYFLSIAYDGDKWQRNSVTPWLKAWATRDFGEAVADEVAHVMGTYSVCLASRRCILDELKAIAICVKDQAGAPKLDVVVAAKLRRVRECLLQLRPPLIGCRAEHLLADWTELEERSEKVYYKLDKPTRTAYFELVHAVVKLMANLNRLYIAGTLSPCPLALSLILTASREEQHVCRTSPNFDQPLGTKSY